MVLASLIFCSSAGLPESAMSSARVVSPVNSSAPSFLNAGSPRTDSMASRSSRLRSVKISHRSLSGMRLSSAPSNLPRLTAAASCITCAGRMTGRLLALRTIAFQRCLTSSPTLIWSISARYLARPSTKSSTTFSSAALALNPGSMQSGYVPPIIWFPSSSILFFSFDISTIDETRLLCIPRADASFSQHELSAPFIASFISRRVSTRAENFALCFSRACAISAGVLHLQSSSAISGCRLATKAPWERDDPPSLTFSASHISANLFPIAASTKSWFARAVYSCTISSTVISRPAAFA